MAQPLAIEDIVASRQIQYLMHFTPATNVQGILQYGLVPRTAFAGLPYQPKVNDGCRVDGCESATCLSISFPNYKTFYYFRKSDSSVDWAVLVINPSVLWTHDCAYCIENAASNNVRHLPLEDRKGPHALSRMFDEFDGKPSRQALGISDASPTNPQAEVLVFDTIAPELILGVVFESDQTKNKYSAAYGNKAVTHSGLFGARKDYQHWR